MTQEANDKPRRGKAVKPAMIHVNMRLPEEVLAFFKAHSQYTLEMRKVLVSYYEKALEKGDYHED